MWDRYTDAELTVLALNANRIAALHHRAGRPYMAELCEKRADELVAALAARRTAEAA